MNFLFRAAKRASAARRIAIIPYYGYGRQDRKDESRKTISAADVAKDIVNSGATSLFSFDLHAEQIAGAIDEPWDQLTASVVLAPEILKETEGGQDLVVVSPDVGGAKRAQGYLNLLPTEDLAIVYKKRDSNRPNQSNALGLLGKVGGRDVVIVDDMIDTAGTMANAARLLRHKGARRIIVAATHGVLSGDALKNIQKSPIDLVIITDTIDQPQSVRNHPKIRIVSVAPLIAQAIERMQSGDSLSKLLPDKSKKPEPVRLEGVTNAMDVFDSQEREGITRDLREQARVRRRSSTTARANRNVMQG
jgi:ribose-phosphate pyrophosphokinase